MASVRSTITSPRCGQRDVKFR